MRGLCNIFHRKMTLLKTAGSENAKIDFSSIFVCFALMVILFVIAVIVQSVATCFVLIHFKYEFSRYKEHKKNRGEKFSGSKKMRKKDVLQGAVETAISPALIRNTDTPDTHSSIIYLYNDYT